MPVFGIFASIQTIFATGNSANFGDTTVTRYCSGTASATRSLWFGGGSPTTATIDYVQTAALGNSADFGDLITGRNYHSGSSNLTRAVYAGGEAPSVDSFIQYITMATLGNGNDFGDISGRTQAEAGAGSNAHGGIG